MAERRKQPDTMSAGAADTGDDFDGCRDLDHTSANVQKNIKLYLHFLLEEMGYGFPLRHGEGLRSEIHQAVQRGRPAGILRRRVLGRLGIEGGKLDIQYRQDKRGFRLPDEVPHQECFRWRLEQTQQLRLVVSGRQQQLGTVCGDASSTTTTLANRHPTPTRSAPT